MLLLNGRKDQEGIEAKSGDKRLGSHGRQHMSSMLHQIS